MCDQFLSHGLPEKRERRIVEEKSVSSEARNRVESRAQLLDQEENDEENMKEKVVKYLMVEL